SATPFLQQWVAHTTVQISAEATQSKDGVAHEFVGWEHGGSRIQSFKAPAGKHTYTAKYRAVVGGSNGGALIGVAPERVLDTRRSGQGPCLRGSRQVPVAPSDGVPSDASAVALNVTVVDPSSGGYLTVHPSGVDRPNASNLNY